MDTDLVLAAMDLVMENSVETNFLKHNQFEYQDDALCSTQN